MLSLLPYECCIDARTTVSQAVCRDVIMSGLLLGGSY
jgi:hypothetical protein